MNQFMSGAVMMASLCSGIFFLKFWRKTEDRFFVLFASAFFLFAIERCCFAFNPLLTPIDTLSWIYLIRLLAFLLIIVAVIDKNRT